MPDEPNNTISFRLSDKGHKRLAEYAEQAGLTKHQAAKALLVRALDSAMEEELLGCLNRIDSAATNLRTAMGRGVACILANVTQLSQREIDDWVRNQMLARTAPPKAQEPSEDAKP